MKITTNIIKSLGLTATMSAAILANDLWAERYLGTQCRVIEGDVNFTLNGRIANVSQSDPATVQCPIDATSFYISPVVTFQDNNSNAGQDVACYTLGRSEEYIDQSSVTITSATVTTSDVDSDGFTGSGQVDTMTLPEIYLTVVGGGALVQCELPPATSASASGRSKILLIEGD